MSSVSRSRGARRRAPGGVRPPELLAAGGVWLRRARTSDAAALFTSYASDPAATRYLSWPPRRSVREVARWLAPRVAGWDDGSELRWVLVDAPEGDAFGTVSLRRTDGGFDLGYALSVARSGDGIATTAVGRVLAWLDGGLGAVVEARTDPEHAASLTVLRRNGFHEVRREVGAWRRPSLGDELRDSLVLRRPAAR